MPTELTWPAVAEYVLQRCRDLIPGTHAQGWNSHFGHLVPAETALKIADRLYEMIRNGDAEEFSRRYKRGNEDPDYQFSVELLKRFVTFCRDSGGFRINLAFPVAGLFTGYYRRMGAVAVLQALMYLFTFVSLQSLARRRNRMEQ
jgi:hypothetical protein